MKCPKQEQKWIEAVSRSQGLHQIEIEFRQCLAENCHSDFTEEVCMSFNGSQQAAQLLWGSGAADVFII
jgi:hypothetical protein